MDSPFFIIGIVAMFAGMILKRILGEQALRRLTTEEKVTLIDGFSRMRAYGSLPLILIAAGFVALLSFPHEWVVRGYFGLCAAFVGFNVWLHLYIRRRLRQLSISEAYCRAILRAQWVSLLGFLIFFVCLGITMIR